MAFVCLILLSKTLRAESFGSKFSRCVIDTMNNSGTTEEKAWKICESVAQKERDAEILQQSAPSSEKSSGKNNGAYNAYLDLLVSEDKQKKCIDDAMRPALNANSDEFAGQAALSKAASESLKCNYDKGATKTQEQAAEHQALGKRYGVPTAIIAADPETWKTRAKLEDRQKLSPNPYDNIALPDAGKNGVSVNQSSQPGIIEKSLAYAIAAAIVAALMMLIRAKPWRWRPKLSGLNLSKYVTGANTIQKRVCLAVFPVATAVALFLLIRDTHWFDYLDEIRLITVLFTITSIALPVIALSSLLDWINGASRIDSTDK